MLRGVAEQDLAAVEPWIFVALFTPQYLADLAQIPVQNCIDRIHAYLTIKTQNIGCENGQSPIVTWNSGKGFTHPTLDSRSAIELIRKLQNLPEPNQAEIANAPANYGAEQPKPVTIMTADDFDLIQIY